MSKCFKKFAPNKYEITNAFFHKSIYTFFLCASNYFFLDEELIKIKIKDINYFLFRDISKEWNNIKSVYEHEQKYLSEIRYAEWFYLKVVLCAIHSTKSKILQDKYFDKLSSLIFEKFNDFAVKNKYMILGIDRKEVSIMNNATSPSKWKKILIDLEN